MKYNISACKTCKNKGGCMTEFYAKLVLPSVIEMYQTPELNGIELIASCDKCTNLPILEATESLKRRMSNE